METPARPTRSLATTEGAPDTPISELWVPRIVGRTSQWPLGALFGITARDSRSSSWTRTASNPNRLGLRTTACSGTSAPDWGGSVSYRSQGRIESAEAHIRPSQGATVSTQAQET